LEEKKFTLSSDFVNLISLLTNRQAYVDNVDIIYRNV